MTLDDGGGGDVDDDDDDDDGDDDICFCFFAAAVFAGFAFDFCFSSGAAVGVEGVWPLLTHVILAAALESFWLKRFGSSFLAQEE